MYRKTKHIHFVGIGGIGMSGIAELLLNLGYRVSGSDVKASEITANLERLGGTLFIGHRADQIAGADVVVVSSAIDAANAEVAAAREAAVPVIPRAEMLAELMRLKYAEFSWMIETYHRGIKQFCGVERCQARSERAQRNHIEMALRAFLRLEYHCFIKGMSWFEAKISIVRDAVRAYLAKPIYTLQPINLYATA